MKKNRLILCCLLAAGMVGCSARQTRMLSGTQTPQKGTISKEEIRDELAKFEDWFVSMMKQTAEEMDTASGTRRMERNNIQMQTRILEALHAMSEADDSIVAFLDTWGLIVRTTRDSHPLRERSHALPTDAPLRYYACLRQPRACKALEK